ncbi:MAG: tetratricopeptide repeat protein [Bryobacteraceae bacterium]
MRIIAVSLLGLVSAFAQTSGEKKLSVDRGSSYYHYSMGHIYSELASAYGNRGEYFNQAIDHYRDALKADPYASFIAEELSDLYIQSGRIREAVTEFESAVKQNPDDLNARRVLGRIYTRIMGDAQQGKINEGLLNKAIEQYVKVTSTEGKDAESWLMLGRLYKVAHNSVESEKAFRKALEVDPENDDAIMGMAMVFSDLGDHARASELFKKIVDKNPNPRTLATLAGSYEQMREYGLAADTLAKALEIAKDNDELERMYAQNLLMAERYDESIKVFEKLAAADPKDIQSLLRISQIYRQQRKYDKAREASDKAKAIDPNNLDVLYNEVGILEAENKIPEAIQTLKTVVDGTARRSYSANERGTRSMLLERLGLLYRANEQYKQAADVFKEFGSLDEKNAPRAAAQIVDTHRQGRDFKKAEEEADSAFKKWPTDNTVRVVRANVLADIGRADEAATDIRKMLDGKNDRETWLTLVQIYEKGKNFSEMAKAIDAADKLSMTNEDKETILFLRGAMYEKQKKTDQSEAEFRKLLALNPKSASALNYLGYMYAERNVRLNEAVDMIKKALEQEPSSGAYLDSLGWAYFRQGKLEEAAEALRKALERTPKDATVHDHLGDVYAKQGKLREAVAVWESSLQLHHSAAPAERDTEEVAKIQKKLDSGKVKLAKEHKSK